MSIRELVLWAHVEDGRRPAAQAVDLPSRRAPRFSQMQPAQLLARKYVPRRLKFGRTIKRSDMKMRFGRQASAFTCQCRSAAGTEPAPCSSRCRIELRYLTFGDSVCRALECDKNRSGCATMLTATLTMAPINTFWLTRCNETDGATKTAAFELIGRSVHGLDPPLCNGAFFRRDKLRGSLGRPSRQS